MIISTERMITASEARRKFGQLLEEMARDTGSYYVILENGKLRALLIPPQFFKKLLKSQGRKSGEEFMNLEKIRTDWDRHTESISEAVGKLKKLDKKDLPKLLR